MRKMLVSVYLVVLFACFFAVAHAEINIVDMPVKYNEERESLTKAYSLKHYGRKMTTIEPQAIVVHWTAAGTWESTYNYFYSPSRSDGTLNVGSQFLVDRDGTIYRLMPETTMARHAIGYNWCAIGIENVGGVNSYEDLTHEQLTANVELIKYLHGKYSGIKYIFGHYQQVEARESGLYIELVAGYHSIKDDPGSSFMRDLQERLANEDFIFYRE